MYLVPLLNYDYLLIGIINHVLFVDIVFWLDLALPEIGGERRILSVFSERYYRRNRERVCSSKLTSLIDDVMFLCVEDIKMWTLLVFGENIAC